MNKKEIFVVAGLIAIALGFSLPVDKQSLPISILFALIASPIIARATVRLYLYLNQK